MPSKAKIFIMSAFQYSFPSITLFFVRLQWAVKFICRRAFEPFCHTHNSSHLNFFALIIFFSFSQGNRTSWWRKRSKNEFYISHASNVVPSFDNGEKAAERRQAKQTVIFFNISSQWCCILLVCSASPRSECHAMPCHRFSAHHSFFSPACAVCRVVYKYTHIVTQPNGTTRHSTQKKRKIPKHEMESMKKEKYYFIFMKNEKERGRTES